MIIRGGKAATSALVAALVAALAAASHPMPGHAGAGPKGIASAAGEAGLPAGFVHLSTVAPTILQDMRYASAANFTGAPVPGYLSASCILLREAAEALQRVQLALAAQKLLLQVYDCYRPETAVRAFAAWVKSPAAMGDASHYPSVPRGALIARGYIAAVSDHSRGNTVDVSLVRLPAPASIERALGRPHGPCTGPIGEREPDRGLDMGTGYDCFDEKSGTRARGLTASQRAMRNLLRQAMAREGFQGYREEWWHFTLSMGDTLPPARDFPVIGPPAGR